jgi:hypothetical protein
MDVDSMGKGRWSTMGYQYSSVYHSEKKVFSFEEMSNRRTTLPLGYDDMSYSGGYRMFGYTEIVPRKWCSLALGYHSVSFENKTTRAHLRMGIGAKSL